MKIFVDNDTGRVVLERYWKWLVIGTPKLKQEYIQRGEVEKNERFLEIDVFDLDKGFGVNKIINHISDKDSVRTNLVRHFFKQTLKSKLIGLGLQEKTSRQVAHSCNSLLEAREYMRIRGIKQYKLIQDGKD